MRDTMSTQPHYFFAVRLPEWIKKTMHDQMMEITSVFHFKRWVHRADYHITLAFLGAVEEKRLLAALQLVGEALQEKRSFPLRIERLDIFGNERSPRIFFAGVNDESQLYALQKTVYEQCTAAGFTLETRPYHPHITLARKWSATSEFTIALLEQCNPFGETPLSFQVEEVVLYKTNIEKTPKYEPIVSLLLK